MDAIQDYRFGVLAALVKNALRAKGDEGSSPEDFFPAVQELLDEAGAGRRLDRDEGLAAIEMDYEKALERLSEAG